MTYEEAKHLLYAHCVPLEPHGDILAADEGFLTSLRPYTGSLIEKNFHLVMEALVTVGESLRESLIDREVMSNVFTLCFLGRHWGLHPKGMLQRNKLIAPAEIERLNLWIDIIESTVHALLSRVPLHHSITEYTSYLIEVGWWENVDFFIPLLARAIEDVQIAYLSRRPIEALARLGARARPALPTLHSALAQPYEFGPEIGNRESWIEGIREEIRHAIQAIESASEPPT